MARIVTNMKRLLPSGAFQLLRRLRFEVTAGYRRYSYSQEGEDLILWRLLEGTQKGFYVDIGAHHPTKFSNTYLFYRAGWSGLNCDPSPGSMKRFARVRPRDINLEIGISDRETSLVLYMFEEPTLNTFDVGLVPAYAAKFRLLGTRRVPTLPLRAVLSQSLPPGRTIDFLTIDVEGFELSVLQSNDWSRYRPAFVLVECQGVTLATLSENRTYHFMKANGYEVCAKTMQTFFFAAQ
jgi:FkbM family methyltransferase